MAEDVMDQIVAELRRSAMEHYPERSQLRNIRIVGHTPKNDHDIYDIVVDFADGSERLAAKVYRASKCGLQGGIETGLPTACSARRTLTEAWGHRPRFIRHLLSGSQFIRSIAMHVGRDPAAA